MQDEALSRVVSKSSGSKVLAHSSETEAGAT